MGYRYRVTIEYDGSLFSGWQRQEGCLSIQQAIEEAIFALSSQRTTVMGAGRTDAGVHALAQVAHFDLDKEYPPHTIRDALNYFLISHPISILNAELVPNSFHARFSAVGRSYIYLISNRPSPPALDSRRSWHIPERLNITAMHDAAQILLGYHDFSSFCSSQCQSKSKLKTLDSITVSANEQQVAIHLRARSFLHNQVRIMVGTLRKIGNGRWSIDRLQEALNSRDRSKAGETAPPYGLYLEKIFY